MRRGFRVLLVVSLLVNVFAVGALGGGAVMLLRPRMLQIPGQEPGMRGRPIMTVGQGLPQPDRRRFRLAMVAALRQNKDLLQTERESRRAAAELFIRPQFDEPAIAAELARAAAAETLLRDRLQATALDFAASLPESEREVLAQGLVRGGMLARQTNAKATLQKPE